MATPTLDIVIVNWNAGSQLSRVIKSIAVSKQTHFILQHVIVVDNGSHDNSESAAEHTALSTILIKNQRNEGFALGCNQGAAQSTADYMLFLNPDTQLRESTLDNTFVYLSTQPTDEKVGITGIQMVDEQGIITRTCARHPSPFHFVMRSSGLSRKLPHQFQDYLMADWPHDETRRVDHVIGAFFLVKSLVFEALGGFDERFFVYLEDVDFCVRARQAGWTIHYTSAAQVFHKGGGVSEQAKAHRLYYSLESRIRYTYKHFNPFTATLITCLTLFIEPAIRLLDGFLRKSPGQVSATLQAYLKLWSSLPVLLD